MECRDERESIPIFIHSALDDAGLTVYGFRLYCRIARRAGSGGECYETMPNMAEGCNMTRKRATKALRELESRGMVRIDAEPGKAKRITLTPKARWTTPGENTQGENAQGGRAESPEVPRAKSPDEGTPTKVLPKGTTHPPRASESPSVPDDPVEAHEQATDERLTSQYFKDLIRTKVGSDPDDLALWYAECEEWAASGYNCRNIKNLVRKFEDSRDDHEQRRTRKGKSESPSEAFQRIYDIASQA